MKSALCAGGGFFNPFNLEIKQIANTNVLHWAGRTFALHEVTAPSPCDVWSLSLPLKVVCLADKCRVAPVVVMMMMPALGSRPILLWPGAFDGVWPAICAAEEILTIL